ncbi:MAG: hypothetical protein FWC89_09220 [Defluviitaleaceae bacterium]|nr:hypothetical protein [Defluviitaleaceae bacterium]
MPVGQGFAGIRFIFRIAFAIIRTCTIAIGIHIDAKSSNEFIVDLKPQITQINKSVIKIPSMLGAIKNTLSATLL